MGKYGTFSATILADTPVAYYRIDDGVGSIVLGDSSGNARNGVITATGATANFTSGFNQSYEDNKAWQVDGTSGDLVSSTNAALVFGANVDYTIEFIFYMAGTLGVLCRDDTSAAGHIAFFNSGGFIACRSGGTTNVSGVASTAYNDFAWHYCQFVRRGGASPSNELYIDGVQIINATTGTGAVTTKWHLGKNGTVAAYTAAFLDEWSLYNGALSTTRLDAHYRAWKTQTTPSPLLSGVG
jgi:hypothetical protein